MDNRLDWTFPFASSSLAYSRSIGSKIDIRLPMVFACMLRFEISQKFSSHELASTWRNSSEDNIIGPHSYI